MELIHEVKDINVQLKEITKVIDMLAIANEHRADVITEIFNNAKIMQSELNNIKTIVHDAKDMAKTMKILSINTQLECARLSKDGLALDYIAKEFKNLTDSNEKFANNAEIVIDYILNKINSLISDMEQSTISVQENSASLEEVNANVEEISNNLNELIIKI